MHKLSLLIKSAKHFEQRKEDKKGYINTKKTFIHINTC